jgi:hypothetical protein
MYSDKYYLQVMINWKDIGDFIRFQAEGMVPFDQGQSVRIGE